MSNKLKSLLMITTMAMMMIKGEHPCNSMVLGPVVSNLSSKSSFSDFGFLKEGGCYSEFHSIRKKTFTRSKR